MYLVDSEIKKMCNENALIIEGYCSDNVGAISYDMEIDHIISKFDTKNKSDAPETYTLKPNETVFVKTKEKIKLPEDFIGYVSEKNSVMREGLVVDAPIYQPGHETYCFLRVHNISGCEIQLNKGKKIAQIMFSKLDRRPDEPYSRKADASFNEENQYVGFGRYEKEYKKEIKKISKISEDLESKIQVVYSNVLVLMGIIAAIFSMITLNFGAIKERIDLISVFSMNLTFTFIVSFLMGLILTFTNKGFRKKCVIPYWIIVALVFVANIVLLFLKK